MVATSVIPLGGDSITKDLSIGLRTSTEEAEEVKLNYGHAYYNDAREEETFQVSVIGSDTKQTFNQLQIADMIEARLEEIYMYADREIKRLGFRELPGGYVLTGGTMKLPGALELAQDVFRSNVRIAIPDYIGVREPQYTASIGILQFAYYNAKIQGKDLFPGVNMNDPRRVKKKVHQSSMDEDKPEKKKESRIANLFKYFFD